MSSDRHAPETLCRVINSNDMLSVSPQGPGGDKRTPEELAGTACLRDSPQCNCGEGGSAVPAPTTGVNTPPEPSLCHHPVPHQLPSKEAKLGLSRFTGTFKIFPVSGGKPTRSFCAFSEKDRSSQGRERAGAAESLLLSDWETLRGLARTRDHPLCAPPAPRLPFLSFFLRKLSHFVQIPIGGWCCSPGAGAGRAPGLQLLLGQGREQDLALPQPGSTPRVWDPPVLTVTSTPLLQAPSLGSQEMTNHVIRQPWLWQGGLVSAPRSVSICQEIK